MDSRSSSTRAISRRSFLRLATLAGIGASSTSLLVACQSAPAPSPTTATNPPAASNTTTSAQPTTAAPTKPAESKTAAPAQATAAGVGQTIRIGHVAAEAHPANTALKQWADELAQATSGRLKAQIFPDSTLGGAKELGEGVKLGTVEMGLLGAAYLGNLHPPYQILDVFYLYRDAEHARKVTTGPIAQEMSDGLFKSQGMRALAVNWFLGERHILSKKPINSIDDVKGLKLRSPEVPVYLESLKAFGANPTPMALSEVFTALQQGTVDGMESPLDFIFTSGWYEAAKNIALTYHNRGAWVLVANGKWFDGLPSADRDVLAQLAVKYGDVQNKLVDGGVADYTKKLTEKGATFTKPDLAPFRAAVKDIPAKLEDKWGKGLYQKIQDVK